MAGDLFGDLPPPSYLSPPSQEQQEQQLHLQPHKSVKINENNKTTSIIKDPTPLPPPPLKSAFKRSKPPESTPNEEVGSGKKLRFKTSTDASISQIAEAMQKIASHIGNSAKFSKASKLAIQLPLQNSLIMLKHHHHLYHLLSLLFLSLHLPFTLSTTAPADIAALKSFKSSITPSSIPPSSCLSSWDFSSDPCSKPITTHFICGLSCSSSRLTSITLDSAGYSGTLTPLISQLTQLIILDLGQNSFHGSIPPSISSLSLLQQLTLRSNSFSGPLPSSFSSLKSLQELDLSGNLLTGILPNTLHFLSHLTRLDLSFNRFSGNLPKLPPNLIELAIKSNLLSGLISESSFSELTQLETVELSANSFTGVLQSWFFQLPGLQQINLSNNSFTRVEIWKPRKYNSLVAVDLGFNKIEGYFPVNLTEYPVLASLSLRYNRLRGAIPLELSKKASLKRLFLDGNYLTGIPPAGFFPGVGEESPVAGSLGDNCLRGCPPKSQLCLPLQKPMSVCKQVYGGKRHGKN